MNPDLPLLSMDAVYIAMRQRTRLWLIASEEYYRISEKEFESLSPWLPDRINNLLDIGPGLGGYHIYLQKNRTEKIDFHFLDKDRVDSEMKYGFRVDTEAYNSFDVTAKFFENAGVSTSQLHFWDIEKKGDILLNQSELQFSAILSLFSWGFHYPVTTYIKLVEKVLEPQGVLILDVRNVNDQDKTLLDKFEQVGEIQSARTGSSRRMCFRKRLS